MCLLRILPVTICRSALSFLFCLNLKSPNARDNAKLPLTRQFSTQPPLSCILCISTGKIGLWSTDNAIACVCERMWFNYGLEIYWLDFNAFNSIGGKTLYLSINASNGSRIAGICTVQLVIFDQCDDSCRTAHFMLQFFRIQQRFVDVQECLEWKQKNRLTF